MQTAQFELHAEIERKHWWFVARRQIVRSLVEAVTPDRSARVIDVGCGTGANVAALADRFNCVGIDTSNEAIELARRQSPTLRFVVGFAPDDLGDSMAEANAVLLMDVLEHVDDDFALFSKLVAAASPGCHFLVTVPADPTLWSVHDEAFGHYRRYTRPRLELLWQGLPIEVRLLSHFNTRLLPLIKAIRARNRRSRTSSGAAGTDFWMPLGPVNASLRAIFAGERHRLLGALTGRREGYQAGASLIAVLRRQTGPCQVRGRPEVVVPDAELRG
ncbi:MAG: class I SAM-dependent methyltransferase [Planctomycetota bacterium]